MRCVPKGAACCIQHLGNPFVTQERDSTLYRSMSLLAWLDLDREVLRFDRQGLFNFELVILVIDELETLQDHTEHQRSFLHGKGAPDTGALPIAKRFKGK
jgi:hypothetical protein